MRVVCLCAAAAAMLVLAGDLRAQDAPAPDSPADGFTVHVTAPHVVNGEVMGPFHHYCKAISPEPVIQCILFETTDAAAPMVEVEYIVAKSVTRNMIDREEWNEAWHDHAVEIASGRVQIHDMPEEEAAKLAELVATTDGLIFHLWPHDSRIPTGDSSIAQAVSHVELSDEEWEAQKSAAMAATVSP